MKYNPGGVVKGSGGQSWGGTNLDKAAASMGTSRNPNTKDDTGPGGSGSTGMPSTSRPK